MNPHSFWTFLPQSNLQPRMAQECVYGEGCLDVKCPYLHPPSRWVCDYGNFCFLANCPGVHPAQCPMNPCPNIRHCNLVHIRACEFGATCQNASCTYLHPPPCENPTCNGTNCIFIHPHQPKYATIASFSRNQGQQQQGQQGQSKKQNQPKQGNWGSPQGYAQPQNAPQSNFNQPSGGPSTIPCRYGNNCTKRPNCPFQHPF